MDVHGQQDASNRVCLVCGWCLFRSKTIQDLSDLPNHAMKEIEHFFANYKGLENKKGAKKWAKVPPTPPPAPLPPSLPLSAQM